MGPETMAGQSVFPFLLLLVLFLPLPLFFYQFLLAVLLAVRPRGEPGAALAVPVAPSGSILLRSPPF